MLILKKIIKITVTVFTIFIFVESGIYPHTIISHSEKYSSKWNRVLELGKAIKQGSVKERFKTKEQILDILYREEPDYPLVYVDQNASGAGDGSSWKNAFNEIQPAINYLKNQEGEGWVWVAQGVYNPIHIKSKIMVLGGFSGNERSLNERNYVRNETIIRNKSGPGPDGPSGVTMSHKSLVDGFTIKNCGYRNYDAKNNLADNFVGGGVRTWSWFSIIRNNHIYYNYSCSGSGIAAWGRFDHQRKEEFAPIIERNIIHHNVSTCGAVVMRNSEVLFSHNIVCYNWCDILPDKSKGIEVDFNPNICDKPVVVNSIIWGNTTRKTFGDIYNYVHKVEQYGNRAKALSIHNCIQHKGYGEGLVRKNPLFVDADNYNFQLKENSPCIDAGYPDSPLDADSTRADIGIFILEDTSQYNPCPEITAISDTVISEDGVLQILVGSCITDSTVSLADLSFNIENNTHFVLDFNTNEGMLNFMPQLNWFGKDSVILSVSDQWQNSDQDTFIITVQPVDDPPSEFSLISPENEAFIHETTDDLEFSWESSMEVDGESVLYDLYLGTDSLLKNGIVIKKLGITETAVTLNISDLHSSMYWGVAARDEHNETWCTSLFRINFGVSAVKDKNISLDNFTLYQNYPNPFNSETQITFFLPRSSKVKIQIFDTSGRIVAVIANERFEKGVHALSWNITDSEEGKISSGIYILQARLGSRVLRKKMMVVK